MYKLEMRKTFTDEDRSKINDVISQFFEEFNPDSSIDLKNGKCHISVLFEDPPKELIKKMLECNPDEFCYGTSNITHNDGKKQSDSDNSDESLQTAETESEDSNESEEETETESEDSDESEEETETESEDSDESKEETETESEDSDESEEETETESEDSDESEEEAETESEGSDESEEETETESEDSNESEEETETESEDSDESKEETETESEDSDESEEETETESEDSNESEEETETDSENSDESEEETKPKINDAEETIVTRSKTKRKGGHIKKCGEIKLLLDLAIKSSSYEEFEDLIVKTIKFGKREEFFIKLVNSFVANKDESLSKISRELGISKNDYDSMSIQVSNYFKRNGEKISFGGFINEIVKYKDYSFETGNEDSKIETSDGPTGDEVSTEQDASNSEEQKVTDSAEQAVVKNKVPVIPEFEEFLGNIDKTLSIEERIEKVIIYMFPKMEEKIYVQRAVRSYMAAGVSIKEITHEGIMKKDRYIPPEARMYTSKLVTGFITAKTKGSELVTVVDFLEYLKKFILTEQELRRL